MTIVALGCPYCGAPIAPTVARDMVVCAYCRRTLVGVPAASWGMALDGEDEALDASIDPRRVCTVSGRKYVVKGRLASGESTDVFLAERAGRVVERVVLKVLRASSDADLVDREWRAVHALHESDAQGAPFFSMLLPQPVARGLLAGKRAALVYRWRSGFQYTLDDVVGRYPAGLDPHAATWMWRRALELLGWVHRSGWVHGALLPRHVLVHPRDHGVVFCGWSCATRVSQREALPAMCEAAEAFYPHDVASGGAATPATDVTMIARTIARVLGGDPVASALPSSVPAPLRDLVRAHAVGSASTDDAWSLKEEVASTAVECFGPPRYVPFEM